VFKRLAFFAAAQNDVIPQRQALNWLLSEDGWWLWSNKTKRESIRLLVALAPKINMSERAELESAIIAGPPQKIFEGCAVPDIINRLNRMPMGAIKYSYPIEALRAMYQMGT